MGANNGGSWGTKENPRRVKPGEVETNVRGNGFKITVGGEEYRVKKDEVKIEEVVSSVVLEIKKVGEENEFILVEWETESEKSFFRFTD